MSHTNTEQLTQFPLGVITEEDVRAHRQEQALTSGISEEAKSWLQMIVLVIAGSILLTLGSLYAMSDNYSGKLTRFEAMKAIGLVWLNPVKGEEYLKDRLNN